MSTINRTSFTNSEANYNKMEATSSNFKSTKEKIKSRLASISSTGINSLRAGFTSMRTGVVSGAKKLKKTLTPYQAPASKIDDFMNYPHLMPRLENKNEPILRQGRASNMDSSMPIRLKKDFRNGPREIKPSASKDSSSINPPPYTPYDSTSKN